MGPNSWETDRVLPEGIGGPLSRHMDVLIWPSVGRLLTGKVLQICMRLDLTTLTANGLDAAGGWV